jgi:hypothetical protein
MDTSRLRRVVGQDGSESYEAVFNIAGSVHLGFVPISDEIQREIVNPARCRFVLCESKDPTRLWYKLV